MGSKRIIRQAVKTDIPALIKLEKEIWGDKGTDVYGQEHFSAWLEVFPQGFLVAVNDGKVVAYISTQRINYIPGQSDKIDFNTMTDNGLIRKTHIPDGNSLYIVSFCSNDPGAGLELGIAGVNHEEALKSDYVVSACRMPGFAGFFETVIDLNPEAEITSQTEKNLALYYAARVAIMIKGKFTELKLPRLDLKFPESIDRDPTIGKILQYPKVFLGGVISDYMKDPLSRDFGAIVILPMS